MGKTKYEKLSKTVVKHRVASQAEVSVNSPQIEIISGPRLDLGKVQKRHQKTMGKHLAK